MRKPRRLSNVADATGRVDVALYRLAALAADRLEQEQGIRGLREHILPIVENVIAKHVPAANLMPRELEVLRAVMKVCELNRAQPDRRSQAT